MNVKKINILLDKLSSEESFNFSAEEKRELHKIFSSAKGMQFLEDWFDQKHTQPVVGKNEVDFEQILNRIQKEIKDNHQSAPLPRKISVFTWMQKVAAVLFIPLAIAFFVLYNYKDKSGAFVNNISNVSINKASQEYYSPAGTRSKIILPDSTQVWLNADSRLTVSENFGKTNRDLKLIGQAFFDVKKNKNIPFIVDLNDAKVKVTGTTLSINNYPGQKIETILLTGSMEVQQGSRIIKLKPSQKITIEKGSVKPAVVETLKNDEPVAKWKDGILIFESTPMAEVKTVLEKWYNVEININEAEINTYRITAKFDNCSLEQVLKYFKISSSVEYKIDNELRKALIFKQKNN